MREKLPSWDPSDRSEGLEQPADLFGRHVAEELEGEVHRLGSNGTEILELTLRNTRYDIGYCRTGLD